MEYFHLELRNARRFLEALRSLSLTASCSDAIPLAGTGRIRDSGRLSVSDSGVLVEAISPIPPHVEAYIELPQLTFADFRCGRDRIFRFDLRRFEELIASIAADGVSLCLTGDKGSDILCSLKSGEGDVVHSSHMPLISQCTGFLAGIGRADETYFVYVEFPAVNFRQLINDLRAHGSTVSAVMNGPELKFRAGTAETIWRAEDLNYIIQRWGGQNPGVFMFTLEKIDAILNAVGLADQVALIELVDRRSAIEMRVQGLGHARVQFCFPN